MGRREARWNARATLLIGVLTFVLGYLAVALPANWPPFSGSDATPDVRIDVAQSRLNPPGVDDPAAEYVCLVNAGDEPVELAGWELHDREGLVNQLPEFELAGHSRVRVHPGRGTDSRADVYGDTGRPVWNNDGDTITLLDEQGNSVADESYPAQAPSTEAGRCGPRLAP